MYDSFETYKDGIDIQFLYRDNVIYLVQTKKGNKFIDGGRI